jgi:hypothetical protein
MMVLSHPKQSWLPVWIRIIMSIINIKWE